MATRLNPRQTEALVLSLLTETLRGTLNSLKAGAITADACVHLERPGAVREGSRTPDLTGTGSFSNQCNPEKQSVLFYT